MGFALLCFLVFAAAAAVATTDAAVPIPIVIVLGTCPQGNSKIEPS